MSGEDAFLGMELRVHGIGDHDVYSAIGRPPVLDDSDGRKPSTAELPPLPRHPVRFLNWSRTSRKLARILWYLALPFSLVNVAGHMIPARADGSRASVRWLAVVVVIVSLITTAVAFLWAVAIGETVLRTLTFAGQDDAGLVLVVSLAVIGAAAVLARCIYLGATRGSSYEALANDASSATSPRANWTIVIALAIAHVSVIAVTAILLITIRPSQLQPSSWLSAIPFATTERPFTEAERAATCAELERQGVEVDCSEPFFHIDLNSLNLMVAGSTLIVVTLSLLILLASIRRRYRTLGGVALALIASILLLHSFGSAIRVGIAWVLQYLDSFASMPAIEAGSGLTWSQRYFLPYQRDAGGLLASFYDTIPFLSLLALLSLLIAIAVVNSVIPSGPRFMDLCKGKTRRLRYLHRVITELGPRLGPSLVLGAVIWGLALLWVVSTITEPSKSRFDIAVLDVLVVGTNVIAIISVVFVVTGGRIRLLHRTFAIIADIVGFWSVAWHPLSGRSYRKVVVDGIDADVQKMMGDSHRLVLVGHSQGSVLTTWYLAHRTPRADGLRLITCGSPVSSLYGTFFPRFFDRRVMRAARDNCAGWWNFWRDTDPIATPLQFRLGGASETSIDDQELPDPRDGCDASIPKGHGDYWNEAELKAISEPWLARPPVEVAQPAD